MIVDDHAGLRQAVKDCLSCERDIEVVGECEDGEASILLTDRLEPDVVLMDISMPGMNGLEATRRVLERLPETAVLILSLHATVEYVTEAIDAGARGYLLKAGDPGELAEAVRTANAGQPVFGEQVQSLLTTSKEDG